MPISMRPWGVAVIVLAVAALAMQPASRDQFDHAADDALKELARKGGVTKQDFRVDPATSELEMTFSGRLRLQSYVMQQPYRGPGILEVLAREIQEQEGFRSRIEVLASLTRPRGARPNRL